MQKNAFYWILAAILISGASVFTSCSDDDSPALTFFLKIIEWVRANY